MPRRLPERTATTLILVSAAEPPRDRREPDPANALPLHDRSCPRREIAVLGEVDSGFRWEWA